MVKPRKQQRLRERREAAAGAKFAREQLAYLPPNRADCTELTSRHVVDDDGRLLLTVKTWIKKDPPQLADFYASVELVEYDDLGEQRTTLLASADCRNHGSVHLHNELDDPDHDQHVPLFELTDVGQVQKYLERSIDLLVDYAAKLASNGR